MKKLLVLSVLLLTCSTTFAQVSKSQATLKISIVKINKDVRKSNPFLRDVIWQYVNEKSFTYNDTLFTFVHYQEVSTVGVSLKKDVKNTSIPKNFKTLVSEKDYDYLVYPENSFVPLSGDEKMTILFGLSDDLIDVIQPDDCPVVLMNTFINALLDRLKIEKAKYK